jgi:trehalose 6-phosphate phosphatase
MAKHAIRQFALLQAQARGRIPSLFLDFDGTLAPIVEEPDKAAMMPGLRALLQNFAKHTEVAIVSGRYLQDLEKKVQIMDLSYVGTHGLQIRLKHSSSVHEEISLDHERQNVANLTKELFRCLHGKFRVAGRKCGGVRVELKDTCVAVHYRDADQGKVGEILDTVDKIVKPYSSLRKLESKMAIDIRPNAAWDKGSAVNWLLTNNADRMNADPFPIYIGDDETDQDAFKVVKARGVGVYVGPPDNRGAAEYFLGNPGEVQEFLSMLLDSFSQMPRVGLLQSPEELHTSRRFS